MMTYFADLHTHTSASDGSASPRELAGLFLAQENATLDDMLETLEPEPRFYSRLGIETTPLMERARQMLNVAHNLRTIAKTDHNTLLGTEEMLEELRRRGAGQKGKRFIVGTEITANHEFPHIGQYSLHLLVYFHDAKGFDLLARTEEEAKDFIKALRDDYKYMLDRVIIGLNKAWLNEKREKVNDHFQGQIAQITEDELKAQSKKRVAKICDHSSIINPGNHYVQLSHTDIASLLYARGIGTSPQAVADEYFTRTGPLYVPFRENHLTVPTGEILRDIRTRSRSSKVKATIGLAHSQTYIRVIARAIEGNDFYRKKGLGEAFEIIGAYIKELASRRSIDFVEEAYPRYAFKPEEDGEQQMMDYVDLLMREREFASTTARWVADKAAELGLKTSGGTDTHTRSMTPRMGYGFGDMAFPDEKVDALFKRQI